MNIHRSIMSVGKRNNLQTPGRRYDISKLISESYRTLYACPLDSKLYRLTESHIANINENPTAIKEHSQHLEVLRGLQALGKRAIIKESDIPAIDELSKEDDENLLENGELEVEDDEDLLENGELEVEDDEDLLENEELEVEDDEDLIDESVEDEEDEESLEESEEYEDEEDPVITPEELQELKRHLKEIRKARRTTESSDCEDPIEEPIEESVEDEEEEEEEVMEESHSWSTERVTMTKALKNFRESSNKKAFYKSFSRLHERMKNPAPLTIDESILLYKASNSAMTHLAVELEHNPGFIYTFRECTSLLSNDNNKLLECIRKQKSPEKSLVESYRAFSSILLESEDFEDEIADEDEDLILSEEPSEVDDEVVESEEVPVDTEEESEEEELIIDSEDEVPAEETPVEEEIPPVSDDEIEESEDEDVEDSDDLTDEEVEALRNKLEEMRKGKRR